jgi:hypothetical protein
VFLVITATPTGKIGAYLVLGLSCFVAYWFTLWYIPETKDRSLDECVRLTLETRVRRVNSSNSKEEDAGIELK